MGTPGGGPAGAKGKSVETTTEDEDRAILTIARSQFYASAWYREVFFWLLGLVTGGITFLLSYWFPAVHATLRYRPVESASADAQFVVAVSLDHITSLCTVKTLDPNHVELGWQDLASVRAEPAWPRMFEWRFERFWFDTRARDWVRRQFDTAISYDALHRLASGRVGEDAFFAPAKCDRTDALRRVTFGSNLLDLKPKSIPLLFVEEFLTPFFVFQVGSCLIWYFQPYTLFATIIAVLAMMTVIESVYINWRNMRNLQQLACENFPVVRVTSTVDPATQRPVLEREKIMSADLIPGDVIELNADTGILPCDLILLTGSAVVNEAMLTGESAPVLKSAVPLNFRAAIAAATGGAGAGGASNPFPSSGSDAGGPSVRASPPPAGVFSPVPLTPSASHSSSAGGASSTFSLGSDRDAKYTLFAGTRNIQARPAAAPPVPITHLDPAEVSAVLAGTAPAGTGPARFAASPGDEVVRAVDSYCNEAPEGMPTRLVTVWQFTPTPAQGTSSSASSRVSMPVLAMVARTGFSTSKGQLLRAILYPKPSRFNLGKEVGRFIVLLVLTFIAGSAAEIVFALRAGGTAGDIVQKILNLVTVIFPPALPLALTLGINVAFVRLRQQEIFCINPPRIVAAGRINCLCYDKTGTLTEDGLTLKGVHTVRAHDSTLASVHGGSAGASAGASAAPAASRASSPGAALAFSPLLQLSPLHKSVPSLMRVAFEDQEDKTADVMSLVLASCHGISTLEEEADEDETAAAVSAAAHAGGDNPTAHPPALARGRSRLLRQGSLSSTGLGAGARGGSASSASSSAASSSAASSSASVVVNPLSKLDPIPERQPLSGSGPLPKVELPDRDRSTTTLTADHGYGTTGRSPLQRRRKVRFIGDPLEIQMFDRTGWILATRTEDPHAPSAQEEYGFDVWNHPEVPPFVDTVLLPPPPSTSTLDILRQSYGAGRTTGGDAGVGDGVALTPTHSPLRRGQSSPSMGAAAGYGAADHLPLAILKRFDFDSKLRRMSVIVSEIMPTTRSARARVAAGAGRLRSTYIFTKGAPESLFSLCRPDTIPADYQSQLHTLTLAGNRVLACAYRHVSIGGHGAEDASTLEQPSILAFDTMDDALAAPRDLAEATLVFGGFLVMENRLKRRTVEFLTKLGLAGLRQVMVTGDNAHTAVAVSKQCGPIFVSPSRRTVLLDAEDRPSIAVRAGGITPASPLSMPGSASGPAHGVGAGMGLMALGGYQAQSSAAHAGRLAVAGGDESALSPYAVANPLLAPTPATPDAVDLDGLEMLMLRDVVEPTICVPFDHFWMTRLRSSSGMLDSVDAAHSTGFPGDFPDVDLVVTGKAFGILFQHHEGLRARGYEGITPFEIAVTRANVFARMSPQNKQELMVALQDVNYTVCMTGDGANDSGALKAADIGISIASAEKTPEEAKKEASAGAAAATIAAPFSTRLADIGAVSMVLAQGRAALVASFSMFKFMFLYGVIQFTTVLIIYEVSVEVGQYQYLWWDLGCVFPLSVLMPTMKTATEVTLGKPESNLLSPVLLRSILGHLGLAVGTQLVFAKFLTLQPWYTPPTPSLGSLEPPPTVDSTVMFWFSQFMYIALGLALCQSFGLFRKPLYHSFWLAIYYVVIFGVCGFLLFSTYPPLVDFFSFDTTIPYHFRYTVLIAVIISTFLIIGYERWMVPHKSPDEPTVDVNALSRDLTITAQKQQEALRELEITDPEAAAQAAQSTIATRPQLPEEDWQPTILPKWRPRYRYEDVAVVAGKLFNVKSDSGRAAVVVRPLDSSR